jgi:hypothetical protein
MEKNMSLQQKKQVIMFGAFIYLRRGKNENIK